jgi:Flp pilus assembly protein TadB
MTYLLLFVAVTGAVLLGLARLPAPSPEVRSRLDRLETVGGALVPVGPSRRRAPKPRPRKLRLRLQRGGRIALLAALLVVPAWAVQGPAFGLAAVAMLLIVLGGGDWLLKQWSMRMVRRQLPAAVRLLAERMRATNSFYTALEAVEHSGMRPLASQFGRVRRDVARGLPEEQALERFAARIPILETEILAKAIAYHPQKGQRLAAALERIAELLDGRRPLAGLLDGARGGA